MTEKDILETLTEPVRLISDDYYFKYIFKKTEKIVCAVFYILARVPKSNAEDVTVSETQRAALVALSYAGRTLALPADHSEKGTRGLVLRLTLLESRLRVLYAAQLLSEAQLNVFVAEIDAAVRSIRGLERHVPYQRGQRVVSAKNQKGEPSSTPFPATRPPVPVSGVEGQGDRRTRILAAVRARPGASIKDISGTVTDCSEKTIQRELNDMIKDGIVLREGEKRWSRYTAIN